MTIKLHIQDPYIFLDIFIALGLDPYAKNIWYILDDFSMQSLTLREWVDWVTQDYSMCWTLVCLVVVPVAVEVARMYILQEFLRK